MDILDGFAFLFANPMALLFVAIGAFTGIVAGAIPGLTASAAIAMLVPVTFYIDPLSALAFLYVIGKSGRYGGPLAAILFNTPGTTSSAATMQDGPLGHLDHLTCGAVAGEDESHSHDA